MSLPLEGKPTEEPARPRCSACAEVAGEITAPGGVILDDGRWFISHHTGPFTDPGELILKTRRHCESLSELTREEGQALGPILRSAIRALEQVTGAERIYAVSFNERIRHVHFLLLPRTRSMPKGHVISDIYRRVRNLCRKLRLARNPTPAERTAAAARIREVWQS
jgi:diadenosine tetraphosphate (Ap4A) HIT family hydrolase